MLRTTQMLIREQCLAQWSNLAPVLGRFSVLMVCPWEMRRENRMVKVWSAHGQTSVGLL